jgi:hypothetical protein
VEPRLLGQLRKQVAQRPGRQPQEAIIRTDAHDRLGDRQRDDLGVGHPSPCVLGLLGQEIVGGAEHRRKEQVEVGEHRGPLRVDVAD